MRLRMAVALALFAGPLAAETPVDCSALVGMVETQSGLQVDAPPAGAEAGWCVLDGARLTGVGAPKITVERLRIRGGSVEGAVTSLDIDAAGLRITPALNDRTIEPWLRDLMRLQTADVHLSARRDEAVDRLVLEGGRLALSGGSELLVDGEIAGAGLSAASIMTGRVTVLDLEWKNDGRTLRPVMQALGERLMPEATGAAAVDAARAGFRTVLEAVPESSLSEDAATALGRFILALPQGRGRVVLGVASDAGIGAAQLGVLALADNPAGPDALARFFAGTRISISWTPGLAP
jgi:hypothetical protein